MDPQIAEACDSGQAFIDHFPDTPATSIMRKVVDAVAKLNGAKSAETAGEAFNHKENTHMRIAIPLADGKLTMHFGHCERFALLDVDEADGKIIKREDIEAPPHAPGLLPPWLAERGVNCVIAGGMGQRAQQLFAEQGVKVMVGASCETPERLVEDYLSGKLQLGANICDH